MLGAALQIPFRPLVWTIVLAVLATGAAVTHVVGANPLGLALPWSAAWAVVAWAIYAGLVLARFAGRQGARQAAASAVAGFAFLLFAVVGVELLA